MYLDFMLITKTTNVVVKMILADHVIPWSIEEWISQMQDCIANRKLRILIVLVIHSVWILAIQKDNILGLIRPNFSSKKDSFDERPLSPGLIYDYDSFKNAQIEIKNSNWYRGYRDNIKLTFSKVNGQFY